MIQNAKYFSIFMIISPGLAVLREGKGLVQKQRMASGDELGNRREETITQQWRLILKSICVSRDPTPDPDLSSQT